MSRVSSGSIPRGHDRRLSGIVNIPCRIPPQSRPWEMTTKLEHRDFLIDQCLNRRHSSPISIQLPMISNMIMGEAVASSPNGPSAPSSISSAPSSVPSAPPPVPAPPSMPPPPLTTKENRPPVSMHQQAFVGHSQRLVQVHGPPAHQEPAPHNTHQRQYSQNEPVYYTQAPPPNHGYESAPPNASQQFPHPTAHVSTPMPPHYTEGFAAPPASRPCYQNPPPTAAIGWPATNYNPASAGPVGAIATNSGYTQETHQSGFILDTTSCKAPAPPPQTPSTGEHRAYVYALMPTPNGGFQYQIAQ
ncbi:hypothetical protein CFIMG_007523RA00001 [Ceratocystis fimbriata CBS 114723]|uniref:Uncharacterized protein n=1 Tax=Ceratocystis fimbriata CBS 114723 TaxID=1035309 RepID=A0A2C5W9V2_9PEZI|nr:hypothetical protein CFIMG_007523RA00001 [Ceratocystis fimbriata CBS 114723]